MTQDDLTDIFESADMIGIQAFCEWSDLIKYTHPLDIQEVITDVGVEMMKFGWKYDNFRGRRPPYDATCNVSWPHQGQSFLSH